MNKNISFGEYVCSRFLSWFLSLLPLDEGVKKWNAEARKESEKNPFTSSTTHCEVLPISELYWSFPVFCISYLIVFLTADFSIFLDVRLCHLSCKLQTCILSAVSYWLSYINAPVTGSVMEYISSAVELHLLRGCHGEWRLCTTSVCTVITS